MTLTLQTATVLGAGTMGAAIAGVLADAGVRVHLLDLPQDAAADAPPAWGRNRLAWEGWERMRSARPANLYDAQAAARIQPGNLEDDFETALAQSDWVLEAVVEDLTVKRALWARIAQHCPPRALASSNTSGLPIHLLVQGLDEAFTRRCFGAHFFNPPRYLALLELIPHAGTDPELLAAFRHCAETRLGREIVMCRDTPYFIGNRIFAFAHQVTLNAALEQGLTVHEVDQLTGPLVGRPKAGTFRLCDIIGLDVMQLVCRNLYDLLPDDPCRDVYLHPGSRRVLSLLQDNGHLGSKTGQGFYRTQRNADGSKTFLGLDLAAAQRGQLAYLPPTDLRDASLPELMALPLRERFPALLARKSPYQAFLRETFGRTFAYLSQIADRIAADAYDIDRAMHWGFHWRMGPFEIWDALALTPAQLDAQGFATGPWLRAAAEPETAPRFHRGAPARREAFAFAGQWQPIAANRSFHAYRDGMARKRTVAANASATLRQGPDALLYLELHTRANVIDDRTLALIEEAARQLHGTAHGLIVTNDDDVFSAGADLKLALERIDRQDWTGLERSAARGQDAFLALRLAPKPVVAALRGLALGGGAELVMAADRVVVHQAAGLGLVETGVGLIPGWGGCKEMVRRHLRGEHLDADSALRAVGQRIGRAQTAPHAVAARAMGFLYPDTPILARSSQLLAWAEEEIRRLHALGYCPPSATGNVYAGGKDAKANLALGNYLLQQGGYMSDHDLLIASKLAHVLCGGDLDAPAWMDEQYFLDLEREAVLSLLGEAKTQARMRHMLTRKKPLRN